MLLSLHAAAGNFIPLPDNAANEQTTLSNKLACLLSGRPADCIDPVPVVLALSPSPQASPQATVTAVTPTAPVPASVTPLPNAPAASPVGNSPLLAPVSGMTQSPSAPPSIAPSSNTDYQPGPSPSTMAPAPVPANAPAPAPGSSPIPAVSTLVIAAGGYSDPTTSDIYNVATGNWASGPTLVAPNGRRNFGMLSLTPTQAIAVGGDISNAATAEIFDGDTLTWASTSPMQDFRQSFSMALLPDGSVFAAGGNDISTYPTSLSTTELYTGGVWQYGPSLQYPRAYSTMLVLPTGAVQVCGGETSKGYGQGATISAECEQYTPGIQAFTQIASLKQAVYGHRAILFNGAPLITGGEDISSTYPYAQLYKGSSWTLVPSLLEARSFHEMVLLQNGKVLVCGGSGGPYVGSLASCEIYDGSSWVPGPSLPYALSDFKMLVLPNGDVLVNGATGSGNPTSAIWATGTAAWQTIASSSALSQRQGFGMAAA